MVVAFHPQTDRIGHFAALPCEDQPLTIGRLTPVHSPELNVAACIEDQYISREALVLQPMQGSKDWTLQRPTGSSRLQVDGENLVEERVLPLVQVKSGLVVTLAQRVVLHIRLQPQQIWLENPPHALREVLGVSAVMRQVQQAIMRAASTSDDVLLLGPTGTGKECAARAIHALSDRSGAAWVAVNMAALPAEIAAASLFGVRRGAYTGADSHRAGFFQQARGGTLFLDEIGDTPESLQPMLLRALQERELQVVGGAVESVDLRVIAATEDDPDSSATRLRAALRFRLAGQELHLPTLAERSEDIGLLAASFFRQAANAAGDDWQPDLADARELARWVRFFECLLLYDWPGNVRELQQVVRQVSIASIGQLSVSRSLLARLSAAPVVLDARVDTQSGEVPGEEVRETDAQERRLADLSAGEFQNAWKAAGYEVSAMARSFDVSRATVYRRLRAIEGCHLAADIPMHEVLAALDACQWDLSRASEQLRVSERALETRLRAAGVRAAFTGGA